MCEYIFLFLSLTVLVQDNSDPNWWKGNNHRGEGLFPANFVTLDLTADSDQPSQSKHSVINAIGNLPNLF